MALLALVVGVVIGASAGDEEEPAPAERPAGKADATAAKPRPAAVGAAEKLSLRRQAGQLVVMRFNGPGPPAYVPRALKAGRAAGVILFKDNIASQADLKRLVRTLQRAAGGSALVSTDQEGGEIRNLPGRGPVEGQAAAATPERATADARGAARDLRAAGINVNLAPVGDVAASPGSVMRGRAFPGDAEQVADAHRRRRARLPRHARRRDRQALPRPRRGDGEHRRRARQPHPHARRSCSARTCRRSAPRSRRASRS